MHCHTTSDSDIPRGEDVILVGNPNVGKSVIFSHFTGRYVDVSNYPGTTVEVSRGQVAVNGQTVNIVDTPGTNSLIPRSGDERVTRDILLAEPPRAVIQVGDAKNLKRALLLTTQMIELDFPLMLVLNMQDEARARGIEVDAKALCAQLGIDVFATIATKKEGLEVLNEAILTTRPGKNLLTYDQALEAAITEMSALLPEHTTGARGLAMLALGGDDIPAAFSDDAHVQITAIKQQTAAHYTDPLVYVINRQRLAAVDGILAAVYRKRPDQQSTFGQWLGRITMHPLWGWPVLLAVLFGLYQFVGVLGAGTLVNFFENVIFGEWINPAVTRFVDNVLPFPFVHDLLVGDYGLVTMALSYGIAIVLPIVTTFFIAFSILEDSGYLPRLAVMVNRPFKALGLNGKAVLPMVLGLGCDTMATMTTRILETRKERLLVTFLLALGVPCSAQLGVILGMVSFISPAAFAVWISVIVLVLLVVGWLAAKLIPGQSSDFIVELPPIRLPRLDNIFFKTVARLEWYLKEVLPLFILGTAILFTLDITGALTVVERAASPLVEGFLGLPREATGAFLIGFLRRDYGAAGLFALARMGLLNTNQVIVSLVVITLFVPCIANFLMIIKEYGAKTAIWVMATVVPLAFAVGGILNQIFHILKPVF